MKIEQHGGIVGRNEGVIEKCTNKANILQKANSVGVGGISGFNLNVLKNCINNGSINGIKSCGGISGLIRTTDDFISNTSMTSVNANILECVNNGEISVSLSIAGGIIGSGSGGNITNCKNTGNITSEGCPENQVETQGTGGIAGRILNSTIISTSSNVGNVTATTGYFVGGIIGYAATIENGGGYIAQCYNYNGNISAEINGAGGIVGSSEGILISNCYNHLTSNDFYIKAKNQNAGGILGVVQGSNVSTINTNINNCYNIGENIVGTQRYGSIIGGVFYNTEIKNSYYLSTSSLNGIGYTYVTLSVNNITKKADSYFKLLASNTTSVAYLLNGNSSTGAWTQSSTKNGGYPYLVDNVPEE